MLAIVKSSQGGKKRREKFLAKSKKGSFYFTQGCVAEPLGHRTDGVEGHMVMSLIMEKIELPSARDGNERGRGSSSVSNSTTSLIALSEKIDN